MAKILIVEDDRATALQLKDCLEFEKHTIEVAYNGEDGLDLMLHYPFDLIILDWQLPKLTGVAVLERYRSEGGQLPVIMLTGKTEIVNREEGLDIGADDYLTKPFDIRELNARIRALLRRPAAITSAELKAGDLTLDPKSGKVTYNGGEIKLLPTEYALLEFLMRHPNQLFTAESLLNHVWKSDSEATVLAVRTYVTRLRQKLALNQCIPKIETVRGFGYRLET